jgi:hypothetical protein
MVGTKGVTGSGTGETAEDFPSATGPVGRKLSSEGRMETPRYPVALKDRES